LNKHNNDSSANSAPITLVTGASRGIGAAIALACARAGHDVAVNFARDRAAAEAVVKSIQALGRRAIAVQADVSDEAQVRAMFEQVDGQLGRLGHLVNNAGIVVPGARLEAQDLPRWQRLFGVNVIGTMLCCREAVRRMSRRHSGAGGCIVNLSSRAAVHGSANLYVDYAASKGAIDTFTVGLALEVAAEGIRVNGVRPGVIDTEFHATGGVPDRAQQLAPSVPLGRVGTAEEVAQAILWLLSDDAAYVTGTTLAVTGGRAAAP